jgi:two-component system phosphate regulon sensor histidine kinase PhoR
MKQSRLLWRIYAYFLFATLVALALVTGNAVRALRQLHEDQIAAEQATHCRLAAREILRLLLSGRTGDIDTACKEISALTDTRVTVILPNGEVIGDSDEKPAVMDNHAERPEIAEAFRGLTGTSVRYSDTLRQRYRYTAIPLLHQDNSVSAVVRISQPLTAIQWSQQEVSQQLLLGGFVAAVLFALVALFLSRRTTRPLERMRRVAQQLADGDLEARVAVCGDDEIGALARAMNDMADQLGERLETIIRQQVEQHAVLTCMVEGVLAVDMNESVLYLNDAVGRFLEVDADQARGRSVREVVRHHDVQTFITSTLSDSGTSESEVLIPGVPARHVQLHGTPLVEPNGRRIGGLVVINDITRQKRLEQVRSDFVANVSHELKTPITALKGCVDTLSDDTPPPADDVPRFTSMMSRHVGRLEAIVEDLLSLSRIEFETTQGDLEMNRVSIADVLQHVANTFSRPAQAKHLVLKIECPDDLEAPINAPLLEQAVGNLVQNAIRYSEDGTRIRLTGERADNQALIRVIDQGPGIDDRHLSRIFERFYRVDKARSRAFGGTGLGLSIVKHIALAHHGNVTVESVVGQGSTFTLHLPLS